MVKTLTGPSGFGYCWNDYANDIDRREIIKELWKSLSGTGQYSGNANYLWC